MGVEHIEIEPFGLPIVDALGAKSRYSDIDFLTASWATKWKPIFEKSDRDILFSTWIHKNGRTSADLLFDDAMGGMPVVLRMFSLDASGKRTKDYYSETRTEWRKIGDHWVPQRIVSLSNDKGFDSEFKVELEILPSSKHEDLIRKVEWDEFFQNEKSDWFGGITKSYMELRGSNVFNLKSDSKKK